MKGQKQIIRRSKPARTGRPGLADPGQGIDQRTPSGKEAKN